MHMHVVCIYVKPNFKPPKVTACNTTGVVAMLSGLITKVSEVRNISTEEVGNGKFCTGMGGPTRSNYTSKRLVPSVYLNHS